MRLPAITPQLFLDFYLCLNNRTNLNERGDNYAPSQYFIKLFSTFLFFAILLLYFLPALLAFLFFTTLFLINFGMILSKFVVTMNLLAFSILRIPEFWFSLAKHPARRTGFDRYSDISKRFLSSTRRFDLLAVQSYNVSNTQICNSFINLSRAKHSDGKKDVCTYCLHIPSGKLQ